MPSALHLEMMRHNSIICYHLFYLLAGNVSAGVRVLECFGEHGTDVTFRTSRVALRFTRKESRLVLAYQIKKNRRNPARTLK